jgi:hypothetical protein
MEIFIFILITSLIDGFSTTPQILILLFLLTTQKPIARSVFYSAGISFFYFLAGVLATLKFSHFSDLAKSLNSLALSLSDTVYYLIQMILGIALFIGAGFYYFRKYKPMQSGKIARFLQGLNWFTAFIIGAIITIGGLPGSVAYFTALDRLVTSELPHALQVAHVLVYNVIYIIPLVIPLVLYLIFHKKVEELTSKMRDGIIKWNKIFLAIALTVIGILLIADAAGFFLFHNPIFLNKLLFIGM